MIGAIFSAYKARRTGRNWGDTLVQSAIVAIAAPVILIGLGLLVNIVRYPPFLESEHVQQNERLVSENESLRQQISSRDKKGLLIDCYVGQIPREMPPTGRLYLVYLFSSKQNINMSESFGAPGSAVDLKTSPLNSVQCMITNYASDVLLGLGVWSRHLMEHSYRVIRRMRYGPGSSWERHNDRGGPSSDTA
jgi:hypothetical protein